MKYRVADGFPYYMELMENTDYRSLFQSQENFLFWESIGEEKAGYRYAPGKWSIRQIMGHVTDHERIMAYRIFRFSRRDPTRLPGYDHELFVANSRFEELHFKALTTDFKKVRTATASLVSSLSEPQFHLTGVVGTFEASVADFLKATLGHEQHHIQMIKERYLR